MSNYTSLFSTLPAVIWNDGPTAVYKAYRVDARIITAVAILLVLAICAIIILIQRKGK